MHNVQEILDLADLGLVIRTLLFSNLHLEVWWCSNTYWTMWVRYQYGTDVYWYRRCTITGMGPMGVMDEEWPIVKRNEFNFDVCVEIDKTIWSMQQLLQLYLLLILTPIRECHWSKKGWSYANLAETENSKRVKRLYGGIIIVNLWRALSR